MQTAVLGLGFSVCWYMGITAKARQPMVELNLRLWIRHTACAALVVYVQSPALDSASCMQACRQVQDGLRVFHL